MTDTRADIIFTGKYSWDSHSFFSSNCYPPDSQSLANDCGSRLAHFLYHYEQLPIVIINEKDQFIKSLEGNIEELLSSIKLRPELLTYCHSEGIFYQNSLHSILYYLKSFLDIYAKLICSCINKNVNGTAFSSKNIDGVKLSGGRLINWIKNNYKHSKCSNNLIGIIKEHSLNWITEAVNYRDTLTHFREIDGFQNIKYQILPSDTAVVHSRISLPRIHKKMTLDFYIEQLGLNLLEFIKQTIGYLPNISSLASNRVNTQDFTKNYIILRGRVGRNSSCYCGSNIKFKYCHGKA